MTSMGKTYVKFDTNDRLLKKLCDSADEKSKLNLKKFGDVKVLIEGGGYEKVWLETQPMGGAMYAKRDLEAAINNQRIFMDYQSLDGRLPGSIENINGKIIPQFDKFQGFCFAEPALDVYYLAGKDKEYLEQLYETLLRFDGYLWKYRDSDNDGCLESWCVYDTGEDNGKRYADAPNYWEGETAPTGYRVVPIASMDFMGYSYSSRKTMADIAEILGEKEIAQKHLKDAEKIKKSLRDYLWNDERGAFFDRDKNHDFMPTLLHNTLRLMYWKCISDYDAKRFVNEHLLNEKEFWTNMPLPSVAASDPLFRNEKVNSWSGQSQALTYQRAIRALENYGLYDLIPRLGNKLFEAIGENCVFVQQYDPFTMEPSLTGVIGEQDAYGPAMLSVLEYIGRMYGVELCRDRLIWGAAKGPETYYEYHWLDRSFRLENCSDKSVAYIDGKEVFSCERGSRVETDLSGKVLVRYNGF